MHLQIDIRNLHVSAQRRIGAGGGLFQRDVGFTVHKYHNANAHNTNADNTNAHDAVFDDMSIDWDSL